jgi:hypothetical protein
MIRNFSYIQLNIEDINNNKFEFIKKCYCVNSILGDYVYPLSELQELYNYNIFETLQIIQNTFQIKLIKFSMNSYTYNKIHNWIKKEYPNSSDEITTIMGVKLLDDNILSNNLIVGRWD